MNVQAVREYLKRNHHGNLILCPDESRGTVWWAHVRNAQSACALRIKLIDAGWDVTKIFNGTVVEFTYR